MGGTLRGRGVSGGGTAHGDVGAIRNRWRAGVAHTVRRLQVLERIRQWWIRRRAKRDGTLGLYDWWERDRDLRHNGGHVRVVGRHD